MNYRERMRKAVECPQFGNIDYGEWGALRLDQRKDIKRLLDEMDRADEYIKTLYFKNENLQSKIDKANEILDKLCVMKPWNDSEEEMRKIYRPIKNTSKQEVYKAICDLRDILKEDK